jgi:hypothetical protein
MLKKEETVGCYLCKRKVHDVSISLAPVIERNETRIDRKKLNFEPLEVIRSDKKFYFILCQDCLLLFEAFAEKFNVLQNQGNKSN